jgi:hypothetical protein
MENLKIPTTSGSNRSRKSKEITQSPAHRPKGTGTTKEIGIPAPTPGKDPVRKLMTVKDKSQSQKSEDIVSTPVCGQKGTGTVIPGDQQVSKHVQQSSKKKRENQKKTINQYFGGGKRVPPPSKGGTPVQSILVRRATKTPESTTGANGAVGSPPEPTLPEIEGKGKTTAAKTMEVDLEGFKPGVQSKVNGSRKRDKKGNEESKTKEQSKKTGARKQKIAFGTTEVVKEKPFTYKECVVGFAIRVDKGNNAKQAFNKKLMEGLKFIQQYVDKRTCFLPHDKDKKLDLIRAKNDMPKYQVVMKGYFRIPNNNSFSNVQQRSAGERQNGERIGNNGIRT